MVCSFSDINNFFVTIQKDVIVHFQFNFVYSTLYRAPYYYIVHIPQSSVLLDIVYIPQSSGVVLYTLVSGCLPFDGNNVMELKQRVIKRIYRLHFKLSEGESSIFLLS